jgi:hypothetical protein
MNILEHVTREQVSAINECARDTFKTPCEAIAGLIISACVIAKSANVTSETLVSYFAYVSETVEIQIKQSFLRDTIAELIKEESEKNARI